MIEKLCSLKADFFYLNEKLSDNLSSHKLISVKFFETVTLQIEIWKYLILITNKKYIREINT